MTEFVHYLTAITMQFIAHHPIWAFTIVFLLSFCESLAFISLLVPATIILIGIGTFVGLGVLSFTPLFLSSSLGAFGGDWVSYWLGRYYHTYLLNCWPLSKHRQLAHRGEQFFIKYGGLGVFIGRFFGPLRAIVPLFAGMMRMPHFSFFVANFTSALTWSFLILAPGSFGIRWLTQIIS